MISAVVDVEAAELQGTSIPSMAEWSSICASRHNVLLEGPSACTEAVLHLLKQYLDKPITLNQSGAPLELRSSKGGALIMRDIGSFSGAEQDRILAWLDDPTSRGQVVCTTTEPLFLLVERGLFDATLYYRLNIIMLQLTRREIQRETPDERPVEFDRASPASTSLDSNP